MKYKNLLASVLILFAFAFMTGCGQSEEQKKLAAEIEEKVKEVSEKAKAFKAKEKDLKCFKTEYDKLVKVMPENEELKALAKKHSTLVEDYKKQTKVIKEAASSIEPLPGKLTENMRFSMELIHEDFESALEKYKEATKIGKRLIKKHKAFCKKVRALGVDTSATNQ